MAYPDVEIKSLEQIVEEAVQLLRDLAQRDPKEETRRRADDLLVSDWHRRHARDGKDPIAGETPEQYENHLNDPQRGGRGYHPVTGETIEEYETRKGAKKTEKAPQGTPVKN